MSSVKNSLRLVSSSYIESYKCIGTTVTDVDTECPVAFYSDRVNMHRLLTRYVHGRRILQQYEFHTNEPAKGPTKTSLVNTQRGNVEVCRGQYSRVVWLQLVDGATDVCPDNGKSYIYDYCWSHHISIVILEKLTGDAMTCTMTTEVTCIWNRY